MPRSETMSQRGSTPFGRLAVAVAVAAAAAIEPIHAQAPAAAFPRDRGTHIVRPGDTLESLAKQYLGDAQLWPEIARLNPELADPHWIYPGRKIRVVLQRPATTPNAKVTALSRRVEAQAAPVPWKSAEEDDLLLEDDGLRTFQKASAQLRFDDDTTATISEDSLVFIRRQTSSLGTASTKEIEIELGQADLEATTPAGAIPPELEIVVRGTRTRAAAGPDGKVSTRSRRDGNAAQFMMYQGSGSVAGTRGKVDLPAGTGSVVPPSAPPSPAERLLPAPPLLRPATGGELGRDFPRLEWNAVAGASGYVVEVCADPECGRLRERRTGVAATSLSLTEPLVDGSSHWRVTAVAPSGLDGFPSAPRAFVAVDSVGPPAPVLSLLTVEGQPLEPSRCMPLPPQLDIRAADLAGQPLGWRLLVNGSDSSAEALVRLRATGRYELVAVAADARGRESRSLPATLDLDFAAPIVQLAPSTGEPRPGRRSKKKKADAESSIPLCGLGLAIASSAGEWTPIACSGESASEIPLSGLSASLRLRASGGALRIGDFRDLAADSEMTIEVAEYGCGLALARARLLPSPHRKSEGRPLLEIAVSDLAGRTTVASWHLDGR